MKMKVIYSISSLILLACLWLPNFIKPDPKLLYNPSPSAQIGWYKINQADAYLVGDLVAAYLPEDAAILASERGYLPAGLPVIKTIGAVGGDHYCVKDGVLEIDPDLRLAILPFDSQGRAMPVPSDQCEAIAVGNVLLISKRIGGSFDSRYFGQVGTDQIIGRVEFLGTNADETWRDNRVLGGARGLGAQGKIKALSAKWPLRPCLHINFYSADYWEVAPWRSYSSIYSKSLWGAISRNVPPDHPCDYD